MRKFILMFSTAIALSATGCVVRERGVAYHHVGPGPRYGHYESYRDDRGYRARRDTIYIR